MPSEDDGVPVAAHLAPSASLFGTPSSRPARQERVDEVVQLLKETIAPETWRENGGTIGAVREIGGQLIITQTQENHGHIGSLLGQLRQDSGVVRVQAHWVLLTPQQIAEMIAPAGANDANAPKIVSPAALEKLGEQTVRYRAEISCFHGQQVSLASGRSRSLIYDQEAVVAQSAVAMNPRVKRVTAGAMLEVTPIVLGQTSVAIVEVRSSVAQWGEANPVTQGYSQSTTRPGTNAITGVPDSAVTDRLSVVRQELFPSHSP